MRPSRLQGLLKIRAGEGRIAFLILALMVIGWAGAAVGATGVESLFFARLGPEYLPYLYVILGPLTFAVLAGMGALLSRKALRFLVRLPVALALVLVVGRALLLLDGAWIYPVLWLTMMVLWTSQGMTSWTLAGAVSDTRQAKRLFPLYGAGLIAGGVIGGLATGPLANWIQAENLLLVWACSLVVTALLARTIIGGATRFGQGVRRRSTGARPGLVQQLVQGLRELGHSPLLRYMSISMVLFAVLYFTLALLFATEATERFPDANELAGFLGLVLGASNAAALLVALLLANRLFAKLGLPAAVLTLATLYLVGFMVMAIRPTFAGLVAFRFAQLVCFNGVWITAWQALFNVVPEERRAPTRSFMDGGPLQAGVVLSGVLLLLANRALEPSQLYVIGAVTAAAAVWSMWLARRAFGGALMDALREGNPDVFHLDQEPFGGFRHDAAARATAVEAASDRDAGVRKISMEILSGMAGRDVEPALLSGLKDSAPEVRAASLRGLVRIGHPLGVEAVAPHLVDPEDDVRMAALQALISSNGDSGREAMLRDRLTDLHPAVRAQAAGALLAHSRAEGTGALSEMMLDPNPIVRRAAVDALAAFEADLSGDQLIKFLGDEDASVRASAVAALVGMGTEVESPLVAALDDPQREEGALFALTSIPGPQLDALHDYAYRQVGCANHYHRLWLLVRDHAEEEMLLLAHSVRHRALDHGVKALRAASREDDGSSVSTALENLSSRDSQQRATALEALEAFGEASVVRPLLALWDPPPSARGDGVSAVGELLEDEDRWIRACAALAAGAISSNNRLASRLEELTGSDVDPLVREAAATSLKGVRMETMATIPTLERVLFLRGVRLLSDLAPSDLKQVAEVATENAYPDGELIANQGDVGDEMHIVVSGEIRVVVGSEEEGTQQIALRTRGEYVGEMAILSNEPRMATLICSGSVRTLSLDQKRFQRILRERPDASMAVMRELCDRLRESMHLTSGR